MNDSENEKLHTEDDFHEHMESQHNSHEGAHSEHHHHEHEGHGCDCHHEHEEHHHGHDHHEDHCSCSHGDHHHHDHEGHHHDDGIHCSCGCCDEEEDEGTLKKILIAAGLFILALLVEGLPALNENAPLWAKLGIQSVYVRGIYIALYLAAYLVCGRGVIRGAIQNIRTGKVFGEQFLMSIASIGAVCMSEFAEAVAVMLFYMIGEYFQDYAVDKSRASISSLMDIRSDRATVLRDGKTSVVSPEEVNVGEIIEVKPGERIPLDGIVESGSSFVDTSALTGESLPRTVANGDEVLSGFVNTDGVLRIRVTRPSRESAVSRILELTEKATARKAKSERFITRFAKVYTPIVCIAALAVAILPPLVLSLFAPQIWAGQSWSTWIYRALLFLVVSCPCALVISVPLSFFSGIGAASSHGILVKGSNFVEALARAKTAVFDKTGTLTRGIFSVTQINPALSGGLSEDELIAIAAHAESLSNHPISKSLKAAHSCPKCEGGLLQLSSMKELSGQGISVEVEGKKVLAGNARLMTAHSVEGFENLTLDLSSTIVHVAVDGVYAGYIVISDELKADSAAALQSLKKAGIRRTVMLTGDCREAALAVATDLGIDEVYAELLPQDKVNKLEELMQGGDQSANHAPSASHAAAPDGTLSPNSSSPSSARADTPDSRAETAPRAESPSSTTIYIGDGINDSPVLARADVGVAMGALGSDAAIEAADVVIMDDRISQLTEALRISKKTVRIVRENIVFSLGVKIGIMVLGALGMANMWAAVFGDVGVTFLAVLNALRLLSLSRKKA